MSDQHSFGAWIEGEGVRFRVWAPEIAAIDVVMYGPNGERSVSALGKDSNGCFGGLVADVGAGTRYKYCINGTDEFPDPASRFQPEGVHGPSQVIDASDYQWNDSAWKGIPFESLVIYELHVGTFTPAGTFEGAIGQLPYLLDLGVTAVELMPVGDFPGLRNWGYDGVSLFAPARCYGTPNDLRELVDKAHQLGLAVFLDVVYNHLGPDGNYLGVYTPYFNSKKRKSPWGAAINFDEEHSDMVRAFFISNALYWLQEFRFDGLRLDATHAIRDDSPQHFLAELTTRVRETITDRKVHLIAEDHRNLAQMVKAVTEGGWGLDGVWADDFHHQMRRHLAGDSDGYYRDFKGSTADIATTVNQGWFFTGQHSTHLGGPRGTDPQGLPPRLLVICLQNHDQIGNRAFGERLHHQIDLAAYRAAVVLLLCAPQTPLLFMGQEWSATTPFLFFTNHDEELGKLVTQGRREEFRHFSAFSDPKIRETIPDPQALSTFERSRLVWEEREQQPNGGILNLHQRLLQLRNSEPALQSAAKEDYRCVAVNDSSIVLERRAADSMLLIICRLGGNGDVNLQDFTPGESRAANSWRAILTTEEQAFVDQSSPPQLNLSSTNTSIVFDRPGAVILRSEPPVSA